MISLVNFGASNSQNRSLDSLKMPPPASKSKSQEPPPSPTTLKTIDFYDKTGCGKAEIKKCVNNIRTSWNKPPISDSQLEAGITQNRKKPPTGYDHKWLYHLPSSPPNKEFKPY